ncbi:MAG: hypothetical protein ACRYFL_05445 [Janthinobacterium lividum]
MKPTEYKISDASFIGHYFKLLLIRLKQFKTAKHVVLFGVVLVCMLARYVVLLGDKSQLKTSIVIEKYRRIRSQVPKIIVVPSSPASQINNFLKFRQVRFETVKTENPYDATAKDVQ